MGKVPFSIAGKGYRKPKRVFHHSPEVDKQFDEGDLYSTPMPLAGINVHAIPTLYDEMVEVGEAPDALFRAGIAAPPLEFNESGLRNYQLRLKADPERILNLDSRLDGQTTDVLSSLAKLGITDDVSWTGKPLTPAELLYQRHLQADYPSDPMYAEMIAKQMASGQPLPEELSNLREMYNAQMLDELRAVNIPAAQYRGSGHLSGGAFSQPKRPRRIGVEYNVFDPRTIRVLKALGVGGAAYGLASTAEAAPASSGVFANPDESLGEYFGRQRSGSFAPSHGGQEQPVDQSSVLNSTLRAVLPRSAQQAAGVALPLESYPRDNPERAEFTARVKDSLFKRPSMRDGEGNLVTPYQYLAKLASQNAYEDAIEAGMSEQEAQMAGLSAKYELAPALNAYFSGTDRSNPYYARVGKALLGALKAQSVGGDAELFAGQTPEQLDARFAAKGSVGDKRYFTSEAMDQNLSATRAYNLLSAYEESGEHAPSWASGMSAVMSGVGAALTPARRGANQMSDGVQDDAYNRIIRSSFDPRGSVEAQAVDWDRRAEMGEGNDQYRDSLYGSYYPQFSAMTDTGMGRHSNDSANYNSYVKNLGLQLLAGTPVSDPAVRQAMGSLNREVPILASDPSRDPDISEGARAARQAKQYFDVQNRRLINEYPEYQRAYDIMVDPLDRMLPEGARGFKVGQPTRGLVTGESGVTGYSRPSGALVAANDAMKGTITDPMSIGMIGGGAIRSGQGILAGLASAAGEVGEEVAEELALSRATGQTFNDMAKSVTYGDVMNRGGELADPNDQHYLTYLGGLRNEQEKRLGVARDYGAKLLPSKREQSPPAFFMQR
jgi:hypothetical protein